MLQAKNTKDVQCKIKLPSAHISFLKLSFAKKSTQNNQQIVLKIHDKTCLDYIR